MYVEHIDVGKGKFAIIDYSDYEKCSIYKWYITKKGYVETKLKTINGKQKTLKLHRFIISTPEGLVTDHINGNKLDNRKSNLRICKQSENVRNTKIQRNNKSGYKGVWFCSQSKKWKARIQFEKKRIHLGYFMNKHHAALAYNNAAIRYFGEFANLNLIDEIKKTGDMTSSHTFN